MTKREHVISAIMHKETGAIPYYVKFSDPELKKLIEYTGNPNFMDTVGNYMDWINATDFQEPVPGLTGFFKDEFGVIWDLRDENCGVVSKHVLDEPTLKGYIFPKPVESKIRENIEVLVNSGKDIFKMVNVGFTLFERAWTMRGMENLLTDMIEDEGFVLELMDRITEYNLAVMDIALEYEGFDAFYFGDDWGSQNGLIMGPEYWRKFFKPGIKMVFEYSKKHGKYNVLHACGDINLLLPELIDMGLDVYDTFQPEIYGIQEIKKRLGDRLTFQGGISLQKLLPYATPEEIDRVVRQTNDIMGKDGGYIAGPCHAVPSDVPPENIMAMLEVFQSYESK